MKHVRFRGKGGLIMTDRDLRFDQKQTSPSQVGEPKLKVTSQMMNASPYDAHE